MTTRRDLLAAASATGALAAVPALAAAPAGDAKLKGVMDRMAGAYLDLHPETEAVTEVERYCVQPGQACSYMVGKLTWLRLRAKAKAALGAKFDIRKFHDAALLNGAMPLKVLETVIDDYIARTKAG